MGASQRLSVVGLTSGEVAAGSKSVRAFLLAKPGEDEPAVDGGVDAVSGEDGRDRCVAEVSLVNTRL